VGRVNSRSVFSRKNQGLAGSHAQRLSRRRLFSGDKTHGHLKHELTVATTFQTQRGLLRSFVSDDKILSDAATPA